MKNRLSSLSTIDLLLVLVVMIWGVNFIVVKIAVTQMNPLTFNCLRTILGSGFLILLSLLKGRNSRLSRAMLLRLLAIGIVGNGIYQILYILGIYMTLAGVTSLILASTPIFVLILDSILHVEKISYREWVGVACSFVGIILMIHIETLGTVGSSVLIGDLLILVGTFCWASYIVLSKPILSTVSPLNFVTYTVLFGSPIVILSAAPSLLTFNIHAVTLETWLAIGYSGILSLGVAYVIWYLSVQRIGTARTAVYQNLVPIIAVVIAAKVLGEQMQSRQLLGGAMILLGIYLTRVSRDEPVENR